MEDRIGLLRGINDLDEILQAEKQGPGTVVHLGLNHASVACSEGAGVQKVGRDVQLRPGTEFQGSVVHQSVTTGEAHVQQSALVLVQGQPHQAGQELLIVG